MGMSDGGACWEHVPGRGGSMCEDPVPHGISENSKCQNGW